MRLEKSKKILDAWEAGVSEFNCGRYWHAHESWEVDWRYLPSPEKEYVQALIQACGGFYLILEKSRMRPAFALCRSSLAKLKGAKSRVTLDSPRLEILGLEEVLDRIGVVSQLPESQLKDFNWKELTHGLKARLVG